MADADHSPRGLPPIETRDLEIGKRFQFCRNGDPFFPGRLVNFNSRHFRTFDAFLDNLTTCLKPATGAIRRVYTPNGGHRIGDMTELEDGQLYVAAGQERFKKLGYTQIEASPRRGKPRNYFDASEIPRVEPVVHSKRQVSGRVKKIRVTGKAILIYANGNTIDPPRVILLNDREQHDWELCLNAIAERIRMSRPILRLYTPDGDCVGDPAELEHNRHYVAVACYERFKRGHYGLGMPNLMTSPRIEKSGQSGRTLPPIRRRYTKTSSQASPENSVASNPEYGVRGGRRGKQNVFHAQQNKATPDRGQRRQQQVDYDKDEGGVFKAKQDNRNTKGAREVRESGDTRVDLPIDQVEAEEVKDWDGHGDMDDDHHGYQDDRRDYDDEDRNYHDDEEERVRGDDRKGKDDTVQKRRNEPKKGDHSHGGQADHSHSKTTKREADHSHVKKEADHSHSRKETKPVSPHQQTPSPGDSKTKNPNVRSSTPASGLDTGKENEAATVIQSGYRGYKARKEYRDKKEEAEHRAEQEREDQMREERDQREREEREEREREQYEKEQREEEEERQRQQQLQQQESKSGSDPQKDAAANKLQAGFRGHRTRQQVKGQK